MVVVKRGSETIMAVKEKKRVQVKIDKDLADNTEAVLNELGLNPTTAINMFYKRIVAEAALPFKPALSEAERANLRFSGSGSCNDLSSKSFKSIFLAISKKSLIVIVSFMLITLPSY